jgi:dihydrofolate reductase
MKLSIIVALADDGIIGRDNALPWHLPADLERFKHLTMGHHLIMGRKTFESVGRALPGRTMLVLSRSRPALPEGVRRVASLEEAIDTASAAGDEEAFVAGGAEIYRQALPRADRLYVTRVHARVEGDTRFPELDEGAWRIVAREVRHPDARHLHAYTFLDYVRA